MIFVNSKELSKHQMIVHMDKMFQCQSCNKVFNNRKEFEKHAIDIHGLSQSNYNFAKKQKLSTR
jgi:uncharacterized C2H2 Zn-finger protein